MQQANGEREAADERVDLEHHRFDDDNGEGLENAGRRRGPVIPRNNLCLRLGILLVRFLLGRRGRAARTGDIGGFGLGLDGLIDPGYGGGGGSRGGDDVIGFLQGFGAARAAAEGGGGVGRGRERRSGRGRGRRRRMRRRRRGRRRRRRDGVLGFEEGVVGGGG